MSQALYHYLILSLLKLCKFSLYSNWNDAGKCITFQFSKK